MHYPQEVKFLPPEDAVIRFPSLLGSYGVQSVGHVVNANYLGIGEIK